MGLIHSPRIVTDSLSLYLDVQNTKSYPGSGASWYDLSSNKLVFSSFGTTQTPLTTVGNSKCFNFNASGYWECGTNFSLVNMGGDCTLIMVLYDVGHSVRRTVFEKAGNPSYTQEIACTWETAPTMSWYSRLSPTYDYGSTSGLPVNSWFMLGIKMSTGLTATPRTAFFSINGSNWISNYTSNSNTALNPAGAIRVGSGYAGTCDNGYIATVMCYNKMLSDIEIQQNFGALRARFGI